MCGVCISPLPNCTLTTIDVGCGDGGVCTLAVNTALGPASAAPPAEVVFASPEWRDAIDAGGEFHFAIESEHLGTRNCDRVDGRARGMARDVLAQPSNVVPPTSGLSAIPSSTATARLGRESRVA